MLTVLSRESFFEVSTSSTVLSISARYSLLSVISSFSAWIVASFSFSCSSLAASSPSLSAIILSFSALTS